MDTQKTYFAQIPLDVAKKMAGHSTRPATCAICRKPVALEKCMIDEKGGAVHAGCYYRKVSRRTSAKK